MIDNYTQPLNDFDLIDSVDILRISSMERLNEQKKSQLEQFFTPAWVSRIMMSMLECHFSTIRILDAGAGVGSLLAASVATFAERSEKPSSIHVTAYEIDESLIKYLNETFQLCEEICRKHCIAFTSEIRQQDFIAESVEKLNKTLFSVSPEEPLFNCAVLNPPYRKIQAQSETRKLLRSVGIEASNLYTGFLALATHLLTTGGEIVAITPRSFCNGPYFKHFRKYFLKNMSLRHLHTFNSRKQIFKDNDVLQENIIVHAIKKTEHPEKVKITSINDSQTNYDSVNEVSYAEVVNPNDPEAFIHIITDQSGQQAANLMLQFNLSLSELGLNVSTGRVVDFRALAYIRSQEELSTVPLLYPIHIQSGLVTWPNTNLKKPNAIICSKESQELLVPNENYVIVKRFSAKEDKRRVIAAAYKASCFPYHHIGIENHLNYFHQDGRGLPIILAKGLAGFLNSTLLDIYFRQFNGHTQINATDLRNIKYPTLEQLNALGLAMPDGYLNQSELDQLVKRVLFGL